MSKHISINPRRLAAARAEAADSVVELSPYDIPTAVIGDYDNKTRTFNIAFEYINDEPEGQAIQDSGVSIIGAKHGGKLLRISISINDANWYGEESVAELQARVLGTLDRLIVDQPQRAMHGEVAKELIARDFAELATDIT